MPKLKLTYIYLTEGEFLYDEKSNKVYTFQAPHQFVGTIDNEFSLVYKK